MRRQRNLLGPQAMGGMVSLWGASSLLISVQRGTITMGDTSSSASATITAVNTARAFVQTTGFTASPTPIATQAERFANVVLTNSTTVTASRAANGGAGGAAITLLFEVLEYQPGVIRSLQTASIALVSSTSGTATITSVNTAKSFIADGGYTTTASGGSAFDTVPRWALTSATQVTATRVGSGADLTMYVTVVEQF